MQSALIQRYLGNKASIAPDIVQLISRLAGPNDLIFDAFSGSLAVSAALRAAGFRVAACDINHFSWLFARAFFSTSELPSPTGVSVRTKARKRAAWAELIEELTAPYNRAVPKRYRRTDIFDHYCEQGSQSAFTSKRGSSGRRRFFSPQNAASIDRALSRIRYWHRDDRLNEQSRCILLAVLISAVEKVSNTQGTFHDFPREFVDSRALRPIRLVAPSDEDFEGPVSKFIGRAEDTLAFAGTLPRHRVVYIDPPYNFRQYTSYYFMLNLMSEYPEIEDLDDYFSKVEFVRGQNMARDFKSSFCKKKDFIPSLDTLIRRSNAEYVVLSYFDGPNHWGEFKAREAETTGRQLLEKFFCSDLFVANSLECLPVKRQNYQSYGGHKAKSIQEFLFVARKSRKPERLKRLGVEPWIGRELA